MSVGEKPHIQALERAQAWLRLPNGKALREHEHKRHGTTTLFAALEVATGQVKVGHYQRRRRREFLDLVNDVIAEYPDREIHVILDNSSTHEPERDMWLPRHKSVHFHYTPTHASWLNKIEMWFSILSRSTPHHASFTHLREVISAIDAFIDAYKETATPFEWTKTHVNPTTPRRCYSDLAK